jgi:hypothetical protein
VNRSSHNVEITKPITWSSWSNTTTILPIHIKYRRKRPMSGVKHNTRMASNLKDCLLPLASLDIQDMPVTPVLCCKSVISLTGRGRQLNANNKRLIDSLVSEFKAILAKGYPRVKLVSHNYRPKNFLYVIEVTTRVPSDGYPALQLAPDRAWRWFVPINDQLVENCSAKRRKTDDFDVRRCTENPNYDHEQQNWVEIDACDIQDEFIRGTYNKEGMKYVCCIEGHKIEWSFGVLEYREKPVKKPAKKPAKRAYWTRRREVKEKAEFSGSEENIEEQPLEEEVLSGSEEDTDEEGVEAVGNVADDEDDDDQNPGAEEIKTGKDADYEIEEVEEDVEDMDMDDVTRVGWSRQAETVVAEEDDSEGCVSDKKTKTGGKSERRGRKSRVRPEDRDWMPRGRRPKGLFNK